MSESYTSVVPSPMRRVIAARTLESKQTVPHFRMVADLELDALIRFRRQLRERHPDEDPSVTAMLVKGCAAALMDTPEMNVQWVAGTLRQYRSADIAVVVAVKGGLSTPVVRNAESKTIAAISRELRTLSERAQRNALTPDEIQGGCFSISNLGMHGVLQFDAIINPPQSAVLAVGCARQRPLVSEDRSIRIATVSRVTLSVDHRALDGVTAATFMSSLRGYVETPERLDTGGGAS